MGAIPRYFKQINHEMSAAPFIPYSSQIRPDVTVTKEGDYLRTWKIAGIPHETVDEDDIQRRLDNLNIFYRNIAGPNVAIWTHNARRRVTERLDSKFTNNFCRDFDKKYYDSLSGYRMMANELYLTLVFRPNPGKFKKAMVRTAGRSVEEIKQDTLKALKKLDDLSLNLESSFKRYDADRLTSYQDKDGVEYSQPLEFFNYLLTGQWQKVRTPRICLSDYLGNAWVWVGTESLEIRSPQGTRFAQIIDFKDYHSNTEPGILNGLMYEDYEYLITQSFSFLSKQDGKKFLERQQKQLRGTEDGSQQQTEALTTAIDQLINGNFAMGEYHYTLTIYGDTLDETSENASNAMKILGDMGFLVSKQVTATESAYYAQLPANWFYRPRIAGLTSLNFAGLCSFHNFSTGKRSGNPWGDAITVLKTPSGQPCYLNFHYSRKDENSEDKKVLGNTRVIGQSDAGKTVLLLTALAQSQKYAYDAPNGFCTVFLDKDRGAEIGIRAMGGKYLPLENGKPTGFNPFQMEKTEANILFLESLVRKLVTDNGQVLRTNEELAIAHAVRTVMEMPRAVRRLTTLCQNITEGTEKEDKEHSIVKRLSKWTEGGSLGWVMDNPVDLIDFNTHQIYGFDGTAFLDNASICTPISMYLLHRMEQVIDGRRFIYFMDEFWKWILDEAFSEFAFNKQKTIRKQNGLGVFATQSPSDVLKSPIARAIIEQCATAIYLPNPSADRTEYIEGFKVTEAEFEIIKNLNVDSRCFLIKQGHVSALAQLDLYGFDDELAVLSGSTDNIELLDQITAEVGDDPDVWLPIFHLRRKERLTKHNAKG